MTLYTYINENIVRIRKEIRLGIMPCSLLRHWEIYSRFDSYVKSGQSRNVAILWAGTDFKLKERMVRYIVKEMEKAISNQDEIN